MFRDWVVVVVGEDGVSQSIQASKTFREINTFLGNYFSLVELCGTNGILLLISK